MGLEQAGEQRNERCADEDNTAAGHELLHVFVAVE